MPMQWQHHPFLRNVLWTLSLGLIFVTMLYGKTAYNADRNLPLGKKPTHAEHTTPRSPITKGQSNGIPPLTPQYGMRWSACGNSVLRPKHAARMSLALEAYQSLRSSLYAVQSFYIPYHSWIPKSEERIAPLLAKTKLAQSHRRTGSHKTPPASPCSSNGMEAHIWAGRPGRSGLPRLGRSGLGLIWYVVDARGNFAPRRGVLWGSLLAVFFALWLIGMRLA